MEIKLISGFHDLTLGKFAMIREIINSTEMPDNIKILAIVNAAYDINCVTMPIEDVKPLVNSLQWLWASEYKAHPIRATYEVNGETYDLISNVTAWTDAQCADYEKAIINPHDLARQIAVMLVPKGSEYDPTTLDARARLFNQHLTMDVAIDISMFFRTVADLMLNSPVS